MDNSSISQPADIEVEHIRLSYNVSSLTDVTSHSMMPRNKWDVCNCAACHWHSGLSGKGYSTHCASPTVNRL